MPSSTKEKILNSIKELNLCLNTCNVEHDFRNQAQNLLTHLYQLLDDQNIVSPEKAQREINKMKEAYPKAIKQPILSSNLKKQTILKINEIIRTINEYFSSNVVYCNNSIIARKNF